jgi:peptide-methionine (S)-S-oxide reductase
MSTVRRWLLAAALMLLGGIVVAQTRPAAPGVAPATGTSGVSGLSGAPATARAIFAGGCFWCVEADFDKVPGVLATVSGYTGGTVPNPTYEQVSRKGTGHTEAVEITFDPARVSYAQLVEYFWRTIDPTVRDRQFCDVGSPYRTAIFALDEEQLRIARASLAALEKARPFKEPVVTPVLPAAPFYPAEEYHQDYYRRNPVRYDYYRSACGRDARLRALWGEQAGKFPGK